MTVLLVLLTFAALLVVDAIYSKKRNIQPILHAEALRAEAVEARLQPAVIGGFAVQPNVRYHPGHTWALSESPNLVRVGMDDFAGKLIWKLDGITLPQRGQWVRQGQKLVTIDREGVKVDLVSPIEGSISDINEAVAKNPELAKQDPYGDGWLVTVQAPDAKTNFRNVLNGSLARSWMQEAATRLQARMPNYAGALAQDGGVAVGNLAEHLNGEFSEIAKEFFLGS
jgi:glycine cleavage system H protein